MGACATKPKADGSLAPAPEPEKRDVDAPVAVEPENKVDVPAVEEVAGEGNQSDRGKEVVDVDDDKVDDQSVKRRSLSNLFKEVLLNHRLFSFFPSLIWFLFSSDCRLLISLEFLLRI